MYAFCCSRKERNSGESGSLNSKYLRTNNLNQFSAAFNCLAIAIGGFLEKTPEAGLQAYVVSSFLRSDAEVRNTVGLMFPWLARNPRSKLAAALNWSSIMILKSPYSHRTVTSLMTCSVTARSTYPRREYMYSYSTTILQLPLSRLLFFMRIEATGNEQTLQQPCDTYTSSAVIAIPALNDTAGGCRTVCIRLPTLRSRAMRAHAETVVIFAVWVPPL